ncbi:PH domain-containing protein [Halococcus sp. IIIV-5B]|uniref:PH domain-containing protein n=1 Tax=Halococcus sp. IIIV-5B TaxID=2321230 RepID=UPI000E73AA95|nr:PH domain-containing protein [Halococcus sp. IIIV-5B]RJT01190.1 PH domain-containing protein [Halococcus sp. IIIV-5B]
MSSAAGSVEWVHLTGDERVLWAGTPSTYPALPAVAVGFVLCIAGVWLSRLGSLPGPSWLPLVSVPVGLCIGSWAYLTRWSTRYVFTTKAVYEKTGLFSRTVTQVRFDRVQNTTFDQSTVERLLSYGDIAVYTAGTGGVNLALRDVPDPKRVNALVTTCLSNVAGSTTDPPAADEQLSV